MFIIEVIPLTRGSHLESLSYYSSIAYSIGSIISVPVRSKEVRAMVINYQSVSKAKTAVRRATFTLKKLPEQHNIEPLPPILVETANQLSKIYPARLGSILYALLPEEVRTGSQALESNLPCIGSYEVPAISVLQAQRDECIRAYRSRIREAFAHRGSVLMVAPTSADVERLKEALSPGIEKRITTLTSSMSPKKKARAYEEFHDLSHAKLIIVTPSHVFLDRHDITHIIIDQSRSPYYKSRIRPYLDTRDVLKTLGKITGRQIIMGDLLPRTEDEYMRREDIYLTEGEHPKRLVFPGKLEIIMQEDTPKPDVPFELFSPKLKEALATSIKSRKNTFLFAARRGIAPVVICIDCGHIFRCPDSGAPYSLLRQTKNGEELRWFLSTTSGKRIKAADTCPDCGSWRLKERGIGIQHVYDEIKKLFPKANIILFDHTTATTSRKASALIAHFYDNKGAVLLGTSMALPYLEMPVFNSVVVSLDATRAIPTWKADEELLALLLRLRENTTNTVYVQTRTKKDDILEYAKAGLVDQFYTDELELREALSYPPFAIFVHLTLSGSAQSIAPLEKFASEVLEKFSVKFYSAPHSTEAKTTRYGLVRVPKAHWPHAELTQALISLPPSIRIEINPQKIV